MAAAKTERLLNLVICLLAASRYLTKDQIRRAVPGYSDSDEAFERMFERDKEELRQLGIPVETAPVDRFFDDEIGYRIQRSSYELPEIRLESDEAAVLGLAARVWQQRSLAQSASDALLKLRAAGVETDDVSLVGIEPRVNASEPAFGPLWEAVRDRRPVTFDYRAAGAVDVVRRHLEPWGIVSWHGRWYVTGHDRDRGAVRSFRLSRVVGDVRPDGEVGSVEKPPDADIRAIVADAYGPEPAAVQEATLRIRSGAAYPLRRRAQSVLSEEDGWDLVVRRFFGTESLAEYLASFGPDVVVLDPPELRDAVVRLLRAVAGVTVDA
jgi:proteasome accessory factor B